MYYGYREIANYSRINVASKTATPLFSVQPSYHINSNLDIWGHSQEENPNIQ